MHHRTRLAALLLTPFFASCSNGATAMANAETLTLSLQQEAMLPGTGLSVHFVGYRDQRCPADAQCIRAGDAQAFFWVLGGNLAPQLLALPWDGAQQPEKASRRVGDFSFYLQSLEPRPLQAGQVDPRRYRAVLQVTPVAPR